MAELEKDIIREKTMAGLQSARSRGRIGGRSKGLSNEGKKLLLLLKHYIKKECRQSPKFAINSAYADPVFISTYAIAKLR